VVDSHCHLADEAFASDLDEVIARARGAGLDSALVILEGANQPEAAQFERVRALWPGVRTAIGVHPHIAHQYATDPGGAARAVRAQIATTQGVCAVGEIGLDYHYDHSPRDLQREIFRSQVALARELRLPVVIHTREADEDTMAILREEGGSAVRGVLHCFAGTADLAAAAIDIGFFVSIAGIVTFSNASALREVVRKLPPASVLTETDSPFLAPVPYRGKRNEPAFVARVVAALADLWHRDVEDVALETAANFRTLFGRDKVST
jgi:TatD DNase family protein